MRVIAEDGEQFGVMEVRQALQLARDADVDLVEVAPNSDPPVCRLLDYGKLRYLSSKKERESKKGQKSTGLREVRFRPNIGTHDLDSKTRKVKELILDGSKVKLTVRDGLVRLSPHFYNSEEEILRFFDLLDRF